MRTSEDLQQELDTQPQPSETLTAVNLGELPRISPAILPHPKLKADEITLEQLRTWEENSDLKSVSVASQLLVERNADLMKENIELELAKQQQAAELAQLKAQLEKESAAKQAAEERAKEEAVVHLKEQAATEAALKEEVEKRRIEEKRVKLVEIEHAERIRIEQVHAAAKLLAAQRQLTITQLQQEVASEQQARAVASADILVKIQELQKWKERYCAFAERVYRDVGDSYCDDKDPIEQQLIRISTNDIKKTIMKL